ncbi:hypothetical protein [Halodesulfurarchaeum sp.]|uniref:hypothetical protein n=1 Tax=Halodesulfurarchaeum sp. TaxID=1980530 RepID=UPI002FC344D5
MTDLEGLSRRDLLKAGTLTAILGAGGYGVWQGLEGADLGLGKESDLPFTVWREIRDVLQTSSTHLPARAEQRVDEGDAEGAYTLVKEDIVTLPGGLNEMGEQGRVVRWGPRTTLRGGAGTMREQAELLASLYEDMGYDTRLRVASEPLSEGDSKNLLYDPPDLEFDPDVDVETTEEWLDRLDTEPKEEDQVRLDANGETSAALGDSILAALEPLSDSLPHQRSFDHGGGGNPLIVEAEDDEETIYADLFSPAASFDDPVDEPSAMEDAPDRIDPGTVSMTLSARKARSGDVVELVKGEWPVEIVAGRQVRVQTLPSPDPIDVPLTRCVDVEQFHPALTLQGRGLNKNEATENTFVGDGVTRSGDRIAFDGDTMTRNGTPTVTGSDQRDPGSVDSLSMTAVAEQFPRVRLELQPRDEDGQVVGGLNPGAFRVEDNGESVMPTLVSNRPSPRVMVLWDASDSMPDQYSGEELDAFVNELRADIKAIDEDAVVKTQSTKPWSDTGSRFAGSYSHLWEFATKAPTGETNLLVFVTDDHAWDDKTPSIARQLENGPPVIGLHVEASDEVGEGPLKEMADLSGGRAIPAADRTSAREAIGSFISEAREDLPGYIVSYEATDRSAGWHSVSVETTSSESVSATTEYEVNEPDPFGFDQLRLTIEHTGAEGETRSVTRTIAGDDGLPSVSDLTEEDGDEESVTTQEPPDSDGAELPEDVLDVEGALFGETVVSFEGWGVPFAVRADDMIDARMTHQPVHEALLEEGPKQANNRRQEEGLAALPPNLLAAQSPYPDAVTADSVTYPDGLRVAMHHQRPSFINNAAQMSMDVLPLSRVTTAAADSNRRIRLTTRRTARTAVVEREFYDRSAGSVLDDATLVRRGNIEEDSARREALNHLSERAIGLRDDDHPDRILLVDEAGTGLVHWELDPETGAVRGILPDASGGGSIEEDVQEMLERLDRIYQVMDIYIDVATIGIAGPPSAAYGALQQYMKFLAKLYGIASTAIAIGRADGIEEEIADAVRQLLCHMAKGVGTEVVTYYGSEIIMKALYAAIDEEPPSIC